MSSIDVASLSGQVLYLFAVMSWDRHTLLTFIGDDGDPKHECAKSFLLFFEESLRNVSLRARLRVEVFEGQLDGAPKDEVAVSHDSDDPLWSAFLEQFSSGFPTFYEATSRIVRPLDAFRRSLQRVRPNIFLSARYPVSQPVLLELAGVTHVLSCYSSTPRVAPPVEQLVLPIRDEETEDVSAYLGAALAFVDRALSSPSGRLLVHCKQGAHRSTAVLAACLVAREKVTVDQAASEITKIRSFAVLTPFNRAQLEAWVEGISR